MRVAYWFMIAWPVAFFLIVVGVPLLAIVVATIRVPLLAGIAAIMALMLLVGVVGLARGRDVDGRHADSANRAWFDSLASGRGPCCSDADGTAVTDPDWRRIDPEHYDVRLDGAWIQVPTDALVTVPNRIGTAMVWPVRYPNGSVTIRCFMPGVLS